MISDWPASNVPSATTPQMLRNIRIRPMCPEDWHRLQLFHARLSPNTVELRFHGAKRELSGPLAHRFTEMDGRDNVAIVATTGTRGRIVGVARYCRLDATTAEVAFVIEDPFQHHGLGHRLMKRLRQIALANGVTAFVAEVLPGNTPMFHLLREAGPTALHVDRGECEVRVDLLQPADSRT
jgi:RimJ/RimL family protein N-acetyltransferase